MVAGLNKSLSFDFSIFVIGKFQMESFLYIITKVIQKSAGYTPPQLYVI